MTPSILTADQQAVLRSLLPICEPFHDRAPDCWSIAWIRAAVAWQVRTWPPGEIVSCLSGPAPANTNWTGGPAA